MKAKRLFFFVMAICLANGVKAQFYDSAEDIYYYVGYRNGNYTNGCRILNFDGTKACILNEYFYTENNPVCYYTVKEVRDLIRNSPSYIEEQIEKGDYKIKFVSPNTYMYSYDDQLGHNVQTLKFSLDRNFMYETIKYGSHESVVKFKRVDKSYFKSGRSRTPSGTMYE